MNKNKINISRLTDTDLEQAKFLIQEHFEWIGDDLSFQHIDEELANFPGKYNEPDGFFYVAKDAETVIGFLGLRKIDSTICEMKRLYIQKDYKGIGLGKQLITTVIEEARKKNYKLIRLDTLPKMQTAQKLYNHFGFYEIEQYVINPITGTVFMGKKLTN